MWQAQAYVSFQVALLTEKMHEILIAWSQNNRLARSYATTKLPLALPEVMMVRYRVRIKNDGTYYRQVQELSKQYSSSMTLLSR